MQKKLIALAIAGLSSAAFAQSNVTIYGVADVSFESVKASGATAANADILARNRVSSNSSYIGFKGEEGLGNGLKALFQFEAGVSADGGNGAGVASNANTSSLFNGTSTRDTFVGISGNFGTIKAGVNTTATRAIGNAIEFSPGAAAIHVGKSLFGEVNGVKTGLDDRLASSVMYVSPSFSGFQASFAYGATELRTNTGAANQLDGKAWDLGVTYDNGPIYVAYARAEQTDTNNIAGTVAAVGVNTKRVNDRIGAKYNFGQGTVVDLLWDKNKQTASAATSTDLSRTAWQLGVAHTFGAQTVFGEYTKANKLSGSNAAAVTDSGAKMFTLGYTYALSKRTLVKAYYTSITNQANAAYDFFNNGVTAAAGSDPRGFGLGVRHSF